MTLRYEYSTAESYYVLLTFLVVLLLPATYYYYSAPTHVKELPSLTQSSSLGLPDPFKCPCSPCKQSGYLNDSSSSRSIRPSANSGDSQLRKIYYKYMSTWTVSSVLISLGWLAFVVVVLKIFTSGTVVELWDPHSVLGLSTSATGADVKRAYRQLSLTMHPDKVVSSLRKEAEKKFVDISKAYKVLTNAKARKNFEMYGSPDGPQATSFGVALPPWMVDPTFVIVAYLSTMSLIGIATYRFFTYGKVFDVGSKQTLDNGLMKEPIEKLANSFKQAKETSPPLTVDQVMIMMAGTARAHHPDYALTREQVKLIPKNARDVSNNPMMLALQAHLHRILDNGLPAEILTTLDRTSEVILALAAQRGRMVDIGACINSQRSVIAAIKPGDSQLLALPHISPQLATKLGSHLSTSGLFKQGRTFLDSKLGNALLEERRDEVWKAAGDTPYIQIVGCTFGDMSLGATPGNELPVHSDSDIIACTIKLILTTTRDQVSATETTTSGSTKKKNNDKKASAESNISSDSTIKELPPAFVHAPLFPKAKRSGFWLFLSETTRPKVAPILNGTYLALDDPSLVQSRNEKTGEMTIRMAIRGPHISASLSVNVTALSVPHWYIEESRTFKLKLEPWSKKQRVLAGSDEAGFAAKDIPAKYQVVDVPPPPANGAPDSSAANELDIPNLADD